MSIGDIHGNEKWKLAIFKTFAKYEKWRKAVDDPKRDLQSLQAEHPTLYAMDKIIFVGDYVDSFTASNVVMKNNLENLVHLKKTLPDKIVLLLGNHDLQYIVEGNYCTGYRPEMWLDFREIFSKNIDCFQFAYGHESNIGERCKNTLWTHAGVTEGWLESLKQIIDSPNFKYFSEFENWKSMKVEDLLNKALEYRLPVLFTVDANSGGSAKYAGPLWVRPKSLTKNAITGFDQVVGHTPMETIKVEAIINSTETTYSDQIESIFYIDCLDLGDGTVLIREY